MAVGLLAGLTRRPMRAVELYPQLHPTMPPAAYWALAKRPSILLAIFVSYVKQLRCGLLGAEHLLPARPGRPKTVGTRGGAPSTDKTYNAQSRYIPFAPRNATFM